MELLGAAIIVETGGLTLIAVVVTIDLAAIGAGLKADIWTMFTYAAWGISLTLNSRASKAMFAALGWLKLFNLFDYRQDD